MVEYNIGRPRCWPVLVSGNVRTLIGYWFIEIEKFWANGANYRQLQPHGSPSGQIGRVGGNNRCPSNPAGSEPKEYRRRRKYYRKNRDEKGREGIDLVLVITNQVRNATEPIRRGFQIGPTLPPQRQKQSRTVWSTATTFASALSSDTIRFAFRPAKSLCRPYYVVTSK